MTLRTLDAKVDLSKLFRSKPEQNTAARKHRPDKLEFYKQQCTHTCSLVRNHLGDCSCAVHSSRWSVSALECNNMRKHITWKDECRIKDHEDNVDNICFMQDDMMKFEEDREHQKLSEWTQRRLKETETKHAAQKKERDTKILINKLSKEVSKNNAYYSLSSNNNRSNNVQGNNTGTNTSTPKTRQ